MLLASKKFQSKAEEVLKEGLEKTPILGLVDKKIEGSKSGAKIPFEGSQKTQGGLMLYTSGTTSRPVSRSHLIPVTMC